MFVSLLSGRLKGAHHCHKLDVFQNWRNIVTENFGWSSRLVSVNLPSAASGNSVGSIANSNGQNNLANDQSSGQSSGHLTVVAPLLAPRKRRVGAALKAWMENVFVPAMVGQYVASAGVDLENGINLVMESVQ
jgi:hypothetical protein